MTIGVVTFHNVRNYGAMLQAYALWKFLADRGHCVEFLDFPWPNAKPLGFPWHLVDRRFRLARRHLDLHYSQRMTEFAKRLPVGRPVRTAAEMAEVAKRWDVSLVGSDQMWNPLWTDRTKLPVVFLDFVGSRIRRFAYAVSCGARDWNREDADEVGRLLRRFSAISVREPSGVELVRNLSGLEAKVMPDPTLLHAESFYRPLFAGVPPVSGRYVFQYCIRDFDGESALAVCCARCRRSLGIERVVDDRELPDGRFARFCCRFAGVRPQVALTHWLARLAGSEFVVTDSFHGAVFSLLFHRPFIALPHDGRQVGMNERLEHLLDAVGLSDRLVASPEASSVSVLTRSPIDWRAVDERLASFRSRAVEFFRSVGL